MVTTARAKPVRIQRVKAIIVAALLMLSLGLGIATTAQRVDATTVCYLDPGRGKTCEVVK